MNKKNLLIIDIGRFFLFGTELVFNPQKGYQVENKLFSRYPKYEEIDVVLNKFWKLSDYQKDYENVICLARENDHYHSLKYNTFKKNYLVWPKNFKALSEEIDLEGTYILDLTEDGIYLINDQEDTQREVDFLDFEIFKDNLKLLREVGLEVEDLINYFTSVPPLPQQVSDYHKSFVISYIFGTVLAASFDFSHCTNLVVLSEWFKSGFLDKSGFISGFSRLNKIPNFTFDDNSIWEILLSEGKSEFTELQYLNRSIFYPSFTSYDAGEIDKLRVFRDNNEEVLKLHLIPDKQNILWHSGTSTIEDQDDLMFNNVLFNVDAIDMRKLKNVDNFGSWYEFYKYENFKYKELHFIDRTKHVIEVANDIDDRIIADDEKDLHYHEFEHMRGIIKEGDIRVIKGQNIDEGDVLIEREYLGGAFLQRLRSRVKGVVYEINYDKKWIVVKSEDVIENTRNFEFEFLKRIGKNRAQISIQGHRMDAVFINGHKRLSKLVSIEKLDESMKNSCIWVDSIEEFDSVMQQYNEITPVCLILPSVPYESFVKMMNKYSKFTDLITFVIVNGFGELPFTEKQRKFLKTNTQKYIFVDPDELSLYILDSKEKFYLSTTSYVVYPYVKLFTFDDWNLAGEVIYNDQDSTVIKCDNKQVIDVADYNLIKFNL